MLFEEFVYPFKPLCDVYLSVNVTFGLFQVTQQTGYVLLVFITDDDQ